MLTSREWTYKHIKYRKLKKWLLQDMKTDLSIALGHDIQLKSLQIAISIFKFNRKEDMGAGCDHSEFQKGIAKIGFTFNSYQVTTYTQVSLGSTLPYLVSPTCNPMMTLIHMVIPTPLPPHRFSNIRHPILLLISSTLTFFWRPQSYIWGYDFSYLHSLLQALLDCPHTLFKNSVGLTTVQWMLASSFIGTWHIYTWSHWPASNSSNLP